MGKKGAEEKKKAATGGEGGAKGQPLSRPSLNRSTSFKLLSMVWPERRAATTKKPKRKARRPRRSPRKRPRRPKKKPRIKLRSLPLLLPQRLARLVLQPVPLLLLRPPRRRLTK